VKSFWHWLVAHGKRCLPCVFACACVLSLGAAGGLAASDVPVPVMSAAAGPTADALPNPVPATLTLGMLAGGWAPFDDLSDGKPVGLSIDYLRLALAEDVALEVKTFPTMTALLAALCAGEVDIVASVARTPARERCLTFSSPYFRAATAVVMRTDDATPFDAARQPFARIAVEQGFSLERQLGDRYPRAQIVPVPDTAAALRAVADGAADAYFGFAPAVRRALAAGPFRNLQVAFEEANRMDELRFAMPRERAALRNRINEGLARVHPADADALRARWIDPDIGERAAGPGAHPLGAEPHAQAQRASEAPASADSAGVTALRLLPLLIGIGVALLVTLRAYALLQREVRRREETERQLAAQLNFQQTMMEMVPHPLVAKDHENRYLAVNRAFESTLGVPREAMLGRTAAEAGAWGHPHGDTLDRLTAEALRTGELQSVELDFTNHAGDVRHGLFCVGTYASAAGDASGVIGTMVDITEIRRAERLARETERRLFDVTRSLPAVVFQLRRDANGAYSLPYVGGDTLHLLGDEGAALFEDGAFTLLSDADRERIEAELARSAVTGEPILAEFRRGGSGPSRWVRAELVPRREPDGGVVWSGYWADATSERARTDELARARDIAEAASRAKDDFLAMMSHEIRTPMNGVLGLIEVLETTALNLEQQRMLAMVHDSAGALLQILDDLLDYSKIEAGALTIEAEPIDLRRLVDGAVGLLAGRAHEKGLRMRVDVEPEVAATLSGDGVRLRQILFNLLSNAIKFTQTGEVSVRVAVAAQTDTSQTIDLAVEDTGIGIAPDVQARLFEPFVQAESSTTRRFGGTGLGLTICRRLIDLMGGTLALHSTPGAGTTMHMRLALPVQQLRYRNAPLRDKRGVAAVDDLRVARALAHFGQALGMDLRRVSPDSPELGDARAMADVDLIFVEDDFDDSRLAPGRFRVIRVTEREKAAGYRVFESDIRVSVNPISWQGLGAACAVALSDVPQPAAPARRFDTRRAMPDRDDAIASGRIVLVAEDHPVNQELIRQQLALLGFACDVVGDGAEALAALERQHYGFLITDCHMPNVSGYELARRVRERERGLGNGVRLPIFGVTASTAPDEARLCHDAGMDGYLVKPMRLATLRDHLDRWLGADALRGAAAARSDTARSPALQIDGADRFGPEHLASMRQLWGSEAAVKRLLDAFVTSLRDDLRALSPLVESGDVKALGHWHHRVIGAASVLRYPPLLRALGAYREQMAAKSPDALRAAGHALIETCAAILDRIEEQASHLG
jgi:two-component system sensor histidine kinase EvgS